MEISENSSPSTFTNWCENIQTNTRIYYPKDNNEIASYIQLARERGKVVRVVGNGHSSSPVVEHSQEDLILLSLRHYQLEPKNITLDLGRVTVNAGWTLAQLYNELNLYGFFLETQPASSAFTVGGVVTMPVHGSRLGSSLVADSVIALTLINQDGILIQKSLEDADFQFYRLNLGVLGVITSVTFKIHRMRDIQATIKTYSHIFLENGKINPEAVQDKFKSLILGCLDNKIRYHHSFLDFHNNQWLTIDWEPTPELTGFYMDTPEVEEIPKIGIVEAFHRSVIPSYRQNSLYLKISNNLYRTAIVASIKKNLFEDHDMFWVALGTRVYFMSYFIPVHTEGEPLNLTNLYSALEAIMEEVKKDGHFNIDFPVDVRFVTSSINSAASPVLDNRKRVYLALDLTCGAANIDLSYRPRFCPLFDWIFPEKASKELNFDFRRFYYNVEQKWRQLGGVPHYAKMFGFSSDPTKPPFDPAEVRKVFTPEVKRLLRMRAQPIFMNEFMRNLLL